MSETRMVGAAEAGQRADVFISSQFGLTRTAAARMLSEGNALVCGCPAEKNFRLREGDLVAVTRPPVRETGTAPEAIPLEILYEDEDIAVVNKPSGMVVHPAAGNERGTLVNALLFHMGGRLSGIGGERRPGIVHRIDKDTSGLLVIAKNDFAHVKLSEGLKTHSIDREYKAIVTGSFRADEGTIDKPIGRNPKDRKKMAVVAGGRPAVTHYRVAERFDGFALLEMKLETGRTHQIRVHLSSIGHPILGDTVYGGGKTKFEKQNAGLISGQALHAWRLTLTHPRSGELMHFESALPGNFEALLCKLRIAAHTVGEL